MTIHKAAGKPGHGQQPAHGARRDLHKLQHAGADRVWQLHHQHHQHHQHGRPHAGICLRSGAPAHQTKCHPQITQYRYGNQITTVKTFEPATERLSGQSATRDGQGAGNVLNHSTTYDALGNLMTRADNTTGVLTQENYSYDSLNRLTTATILGGAASPPTTTEVMYDARGNVSYKSDVGRYWYDAARPNRMTNVTLETAPGATQALSGTRALSYAFDDYRANAQVVNGTTLGNGNLEYTVSHDTARNIHTVRSESYTSFNMPGQLVYGNFITNTTSTADRTLAFIYGPEHQRIKQTVSLTGSGTSAYFAGSTWYLNGEDGQALSYEKEIRTNGTIEEKHYVSAGGVVFALFASRSGTLNGLAATSTSYLHHDQLGSIAAITDENGVVQERLAYDPWGKRRFIMATPGLPDALDAIVGQRTDRGYTMHEHLDEIGVIHMNGRIYDPLMGRFLSSDPFIQSPDNLQSYNRYSYVMNNPLYYTDPSGYFSLRKLFVALICPMCVKELRRPIIAITIAYFTGNWVGFYTQSAVLGGAAGGFAGGVASTGTLQGGLQGALSGGLFGAAGLVGSGTTAEAANSFERYAAHAAAGCVTSVAGGGKCGSGAASAVFGKFATNNIDIKDPIARGIATSVAGGVGSVIAGGKFENGATTAAFGYLFNELAHQTTAAQRGYATGDSITNDRIWKLDSSGLDPSLKLDVVTAINVSEAFGDSPLRVAQGYRTWAEQDALYAQGRTTPGPIVTWARGGESMHNLGLDVDVFRVDERALYAPSSSTVETFKRFGFSWGGDWAGRKNDPPHFQRLPAGR